MNLIGTNDPRIVEISQEWIDFLDQHEQDFPETATTMSLGQVFLYFLMTYKPPVDELLPILEFVVNMYAGQQESGAYKEKMN